MERDPKLISLIEASRRCAFSPEYLNVLVLRGKLKAIKIGRNWFTKDEWLKDYLQAERKVGRPRKSPPINFTGHAPQQNRTTVRRPGIVERLFAGRPIAAGVLIAGALLFMFSPAARAGVAWSTAPLIAGVVQGTHESYARNKAALGTNLALVADLVHAGRARLDAALIVPLTDHASRLSDHGRAAVRTFTAGARTITGRITREGSRLFAALVPSSSPSRPPLADSVHPPHRPPRAPAAEFTAAPLPAAVRWTPAPAVIREVPVPDPALRTSLTVTQDELARTSANFTLLRGDVIRDLAAVRAELGSLKAATAAAPDEPRTLETVIREVSRETVIHIATPPGASLGNKEITASLESGAIAPTTITIGSMTFGGSTLASIQTINSSPTVTGTLTISGTGTSTITSSLQVASYLTAGNLLTVPYFTATSTTATSTIAGGLATAGLASSNGLTLTGGSLLQTNTATSSFAGGISAAGLNSSAGLTLTGGIFNSSVTATSSMAGGIALTNIAVSNGLTITGGSLLHTGTATSSFAGGIATAGLSSSDGLTVTGGTLLSSVPLTFTGTGTSTMAGGLSTAGLASSNGITLTGGSFLSSVPLTFTGTATSSFAGGLSTAGLATSNGITLTGGSLLQTNTATSSLAGGLSLTNLAASNGITVTGGILRSTVTATSTLDGGLAITAGGLRLSTLTAGSVLFTGTSGALQENNANLFWDNTNGRLGIGTTSPGFKLSVAAATNDGLQIAGSGSGDQAASLYLYPKSTNSLRRNWVITTNTINNAGELAFMQSDAADGHPLTAGTSRLYISNAGNVGIGTTSPGALLAVGNTGGFYVQSGGNVGIGTAAPSSVLHVVGASSIINADSNDTTATLGLVTRNRNTGVTNVFSGINMQLRATDNNDVGGAQMYVGKEQSWTATASTQDAFLAFLTLENASLGERVRITSSGNVGIGTTSPMARLALMNSGDADANIQLEPGISTGDPVFRMVDRSGNERLKFQTDNDSGNNAGRYLFMGGNVGIGTTSPNAKLQIDGDNNQITINTTGTYSSIYFSHSGTNNGLVYDDGEKFRLRSDTLPIALRVSGTEALTVLQGGNLGIGTTTPSALFAVTGGAGTYVNSSGSFIAATNGPHAIGRTTRGDVQLTIGGTFGSGPTARGVLIETTLGPDPGQSTAALVVAPTIQEHSSATHTRFASVQIDAPTITAGDAALTNAVSLYVSGAPTGATNNYALLIGSGTVSLGTGNVGIGTTGPGATLDVYQGGATNGQSNIRSYNDNNGFSRELLTLDATNASLIENAGAAYFRIRASGLGKEYFWVGQTGNVGIGTTSPAGKLHISSESSTNTLYFSDAAGSGNHSIQFRDAAVDEWHLTRSDSDNVFNIVESNVLIRAAFMPGGGIKFNSGLGTGVGGNYLCIDTTTFEVLRGNGSACTASSLRFKDNIQNLNYGLAEVLKLRPVSYQYKQDTNMGQGTKLGFIAEEMYQVIPEVTSLNKDGKVFGLDYPVLTAVLTKAIQELNAKLETLTAQNGTINSSSSFTSSSALTVASLTSTNGTWSLDDSGHLVVKKITAEDIETENLKVGSPEKRNGITIYDQDTGDPYCMYIASGAVRSAPGPCSATSGDQQPVDTSPSPSPSPTQESTPTSEPSPAEPENPAPAATPSEE